jgi:hypothetical protein
MEGADEQWGGMKRLDSPKLIEKGEFGVVKGVSPVIQSGALFHGT